jgi:hypothetical protein
MCLTATNQTQNQALNLIPSKKLSKNHFGTPKFIDNQKIG